MAKTRKNKRQPTVDLNPKLKIEALVWYKHKCDEDGREQDARNVSLAIKLVERNKHQEAIGHLRKTSIPMSFGWFKKRRVKAGPKGEPNNSISRLKGMNKSIWGISTPMSE